MNPHDPDRNITMPQGTERDYLSTDENDINARLRHCRVRVKRWKSIDVPKSFRLKTPALPFVPYVPTPYDRSPWWCKEMSTAADHLLPAHGVLL